MIDHIHSFAWLQKYFIGDFSSMKDLLFKSYNLNLVIYVFSILLGLQPLEATTTAQVFSKYPNKYFVESGSYLGSGISMALEAGFQQIFSIELSPYLCQICRERFSSNSNVFLFEGDSSKVLCLVLDQIDAPATFWLDGHYSMGITAKGDSWTPILKELECIGQHSINTHTILIDDIRHCGTEYFDYVELEEIVYRLHQINPDYEISFEDGHVANDVLVAKIPSKE